MKYDPTKEYSFALPLSKDSNDDVTQYSISLLLKDARETLPPGTRFEIRRCFWGGPYMQSIAWHKPLMNADYSNDEPDAVDKYRGFYRVGRYTA